MLEAQSILEKLLAWHCLETFKVSILSLNSLCEHYRAYPIKHHGVESL